MDGRILGEDAGRRRTARAPGAVSFGSLAILLGYPAAHLAAVLLLSPAKPISFAFLILAPLMAGIACAVRARRGVDVDGWAGLSLAMLLWAGGMVANLCADILLPDAGPVTGLSILLYVLYGVPLTFLVASPERELRSVRVVDGLLALALGWLFFVHTFTFATIDNASQDGVLNLRLMFDIQNLFIALFALVRYRAGTDAARRAFFRTLTLFAFAYLAIAAYINHFQMDADFGSPFDPLVDLPFLLLTLLALRTRPAAHGPAPHLPSPRFALLVRAGSPLMLPVTLLAVSGPLVTRAPGLAVTGCIAALLGYGLRNVLVQMRSLDERERLDALSRVDPLTGIANRRQFDETLQREWNRARRAQGELALLLVDIDHFKLLNDSYGHPVGDARLRDVAAAIAACAARAGDLVARYGGEEFAVILPASGAEAGAELAERMRQAVAGLALASPAPGDIVTVSIGLAAFRPAGTDDPARLVAMADAALYRAKSGGRNKVMRWDAP